MTRRDVLFLDFCGVIHDCTQVLEHWRARLGDFLTPVLGGEPTAWADANTYALERTIERYLAARAAGESVRAYLPRELVLWLRDMCVHVGVPAPEHDRAEELARAAARYVTERVPATIPESIPTLRLLHARGFALHTAANPWSSDLEGYLSALGVRDLFGKLYGPDLVDTWKNGPDFYRRLLADTGVAAERAVVIDDHLRHLDVAREVGCGTIFVSSHAREPNAHASVRSLSEAADRLLLIDS